MSRLLPTGNRSQPEIPVEPAGVVAGYAGNWIRAVERGASSWRSRPLGGGCRSERFNFALISDHYHPWTGAQGQSPFVWAVLGGLARETERLRVGTGVTCPTFRIHPAVVAHAAATVAGRVGDGLISTAPDAEVIETYQRHGGDGPRYGMIHVCWAPDEAAAVETAHRQWVNAARRFSRRCDGPPA